MLACNNLRNIIFEIDGKGARLKATGSCTLCNLKEKCLEMGESIIRTAVSIRQMENVLDATDDLRN